MMKLACKVIGKSTTVKGAPYMTLEVEMEDGTKVNMPYFGRTTPQYVTEIAYFKNGSPYVKNIQPHVSRDGEGKFEKGGYRAAAE